MTDKIQEVIKKLKESTEKEVEEAQDIVEPQEPQKKEEKPTKSDTSDLTSDEITEAKINALQNDGIYRVNLLAELTELNKTLQLLTATIMKSAGLEDKQE